MILNKKGLAVLPLAALLFTSCAKNVSYEEACKFVKENYTETTPLTPKSGYIELRGKTNDEEIKKEFIETAKSEYGIDLDKNLYGKRDFKTEELFPMPPLNEQTVWHMDSEGYTLTYTINGKKFSQSSYAKIELTGNVAENWSSEDYNEKGYKVKAYMKTSTKTSVEFAYEISQYFNY